MDKRPLNPLAEKFVRQIVRLAINLPLDKVSSIAKKELIASSTQAASNLDIAVYETIGKNSVSKLNLVMEQIGKCNFWLKLLTDEGYLDKRITNTLISEGSALVLSLQDARLEDEKSLVSNYSGEWLLDD